MTMKIMKLRPAQKLYVDKIYEPLLLNFGKTLEPSHSELPCNFGKTELIVRYNTLRVIQETKKSIHICATVMASPYDTFVERLPSKEDDEFPYGKNTWFNRSDTDLDYFLNNLSLILSKYNHIIIFTTLNKLNTVTRKPLFDNLMNKGKKEGFMWYLDRDEGDYAGFDDSEQQAFESGASVEMGGSKYAQSLLKMFSDYKDNCGYLYAVSGTPLNAHSDKAELLNEVGNAVALTQSQSMKKDKQGIVTDDLQKYVSTKSFWKPLITEEMFYQMKNLNVEFNSWFSKPETYHRRDWKILMKDSIEWRNKKQIKINNLKSWLIDNVINFYPDVNKNNFINIFDKHQKISLYQNGKEGTYKSQVSFIKPSEFINELKKYDSTNNTYVHSNSNIEGTIPSIDKQEIYSYYYQAFLDQKSLKSQMYFLF